MKITVAGGCGEHGRNCFFIESGNVAFLFDCGIMPYAQNPYPRLTKEQIKSAKFLFLSHSHADHAGGYPWLLKNGFSGEVITTEETARQLSFTLENAKFISLMQSLKLTESLTATCGKSGQCAGSVWFYINRDNESVFFSGDYIEDALVYNCDGARGFKADYAIIDNAYGSEVSTFSQYNAELIRIVSDFFNAGKSVVFPVPKYGRGLELLFLFNRSFPNVRFTADEHFRNELKNIDNIKDWLRKDALSELKSATIADVDIFARSDIIFISDPQLKNPASQKLAESALSKNAAVIITGNADAGSYSEVLLKNKQAVFSRYAVHMNDNGVEKLAGLNDFGEVIEYHSARF